MGKIAWIKKPYLLTYFLDSLQYIESRAKIGQSFKCQIIILASSLELSPYWSLFNLKCLLYRRQLSISIGEVFSYSLNIIAERNYYLLNKMGDQCGEFAVCYLIYCCVFRLSVKNLLY